MVRVSFRRPGPSGPCPEAIDLKELGMVMDTPWGLWIDFFRKVVETKPVEGDNNEWFELFPGGQDHLGHAQRS